MYDRKATEERIINALDSLIRESGIKAVGINSVARKASVSKVLIYRYFGGLDGLLEEWAIKNSYWIEVPDEITQIGSMKDGIELMISGMAEGLVNRPSLRAVLRWLLEEDSEAGKRVMERLERRGVELTRMLKNQDVVPEDWDMEVLVAIFTAGVNYLAMMSDRSDVYNGIPLNTPEGWKRLSRGIAEVFSKMV